MRLSQGEAASSPYQKQPGIIWNYHGNQRLAEERKKVQGRMKKQAGSTRLSLLISIIAIRIHGRCVFQFFYFF
jgi:hypothetical protein